VAQGPRGPRRPGGHQPQIHKSLADLIDGDGLSARVGADQLGHAKISMTQDEYMSRGRVHAEVVALLDRTINDEQTMDGYY
jgi:integrase